MIYTNKMRIFLYKNTLRYKNTKKSMLYNEHKGRCNTSHGRAQIDTDTRNIYSPSRYAREIIVRPKGDKKSKLSQL